MLPIILYRLFMFFVAIFLILVGISILLYGFDETINKLKRLIKNKKQKEEEMEFEKKGFILYKK